MSPPVQPMSDFDDAVRRAADQVREYLANHPNAADTVDGIAAWWLPGVPVSVAQTALDRLVREGFMKRNPVTGGRPQYSRATDV
jgi:hypothetical protein